MAGTRPLFTALGHLDFPLHRNIIKTSLELISTRSRLARATCIPAQDNTISAGARAGERKYLIGHFYECLHEQTPYNSRYKVKPIIPSGCDKQRRELRRNHRNRRPLQCKCSKKNQRSRRVMTLPLKTVHERDVAIPRQDTQLNHNHSPSNSCLMVHGHTELDFLQKTLHIETLTW